MDEFSIQKPDCCCRPGGYEVVGLCGQVVTAFLYSRFVAFFLTFGSFTGFYLFFQRLGK